MTNIVERLREGCGVPRAEKLMDEAAAEIERLRQRDSAGENSVLRTEIERQRDALEQILDASTAEDMREIARRALEPKP